MALYYETPLVHSLPFQAMLDIPVMLKLESLQPSASFKNRGIGHMIKTHAERGAKGICAGSGGNAGLAAAYASYCLGLPCTVFIPSTTPEIMRVRLRRQGAEVIVHGETFTEASEEAKRVAAEQGRLFVPPFDDPLIWEGHSTLIDEVAASSFKPGAVLVSVGGGGLMIGLLQGMHRHGWTDVPVIAAETEGAPSLAASIEAGHVVTLDSVDTVAKSLAAKSCAQGALDWTKLHSIHSQVVSERSAVEATLRFADDHRLIVEPACGTCLAVLYEERPILKDLDSILVIICGGSAVSLDMLAAWKQEYL